MGYEMGLTTGKLDSDFDSDVLFLECGWENTSLFEAFSFFANDKTTSTCGELIIPIERLSFLKTLKTRLSNNEYYQTFLKLTDLNDNFAHEYFHSLSIAEKTTFYLCFYFEDIHINRLNALILNRLFEYHQSLIVEELCEAYAKACSLNLKKLILFGG